MNGYYLKVVVGEGFVLAEAALESLYTRVDLQVLAEVRLLGKRLGADMALEGSIVVVNPQVIDEVLELWKVPVPLINLCKAGLVKALEDARGLMCLVHISEHQELPEAGNEGWFKIDVKLVACYHLDFRVGVDLGK
jgi:hypothetical protein